EYKSYSNYPTATISDAMKKRNALPQNIKPVWGDSHHIYGTAVTVSASPADEVLPLKSIDIARPGDVIIVANNVFPYKALWGGIMSTMAKVKGVKGLITDGMVRDIGEIRELEFPIWASGITPIAPSTDIPPGELNLPVSIG